MITTDKIELAKQLSKHFHKGQKYGEYDYYEHHILGVVKTLEIVAKDMTEDMIIVALLHDVLEDTSCTLETIYNIFGDNVTTAVSILTKSERLSQADYIERIVRRKTPRIVKYADSLFNHQECVKGGNMKRAEKYQRNLKELYHKELFKC